MDTGNVVVKIQKALDTLKQKNDKLAEENVRLKKLVMDIRSAHSRVRRIPKKPVPVSSTVGGGDESVEVTAQ
jgi:hypothetical protein